MSKCALRDIEAYQSASDKDWLEYIQAVRIGLDDRNAWVQFPLLQS